MDLNKATAHKAVLLPEATQEPPPLTFLNMVVCLNNKDLNQPDRWLTSSLQASFLVNKVDMVGHQPNLQVNMQVNKWLMEALLVLEDMVVEHQHLLPNGVLPQPRALVVPLQATRARCGLPTFFTDSTEVFGGIIFCRFEGIGILNLAAVFSILHLFLLSWPFPSPRSFSMLA
jgi:hypothetical protein